MGKKLEVDNPEAAAAHIASLVMDIAEDDLKGYLAIEQVLPGNPYSLTVDLMEGLYRKAIQMSIKTLPTFHLYKLASIYIN